jgi:hypothetical protein
VSHVLAGAEPDEFRRLFHGWLPWIASPDPHARRREKLMRRLGLAGRVLRDVAWPGNPVTDLRIAAEAAEEVRGRELRSRTMPMPQPPHVPLGLPS